MNPKVDFYFDKTRPWQQEIGLLRKLVLDCGMNEELKWRCPCYTYGKANIVLIHVFKKYCALLFFKGALLNDPHNLLIQQTPNVQAARQLRFISTKEIATKADIIKAYIYEAIEVERSGLKVTLKKTEDYPIPEVFQKKLAAMPHLKKAFESLTPGRQRAYLFYFSQPKQLKTQETRIEKCIPKILEGKGLHD